MLPQPGTGHSGVSRDHIIGLLQQTFGRSAMGVCYCDENRIIRWSSRAFGEQLGVPLDSIIGCTCDALMPGWAEEMAQLFDRVRDTGEGWYASAHLPAYPDQPERGTTCWDRSITPVTGDGGEFQGWLLIQSMVPQVAREDHETAQLLAEVERERRRAEESAEEAQRRADELDAVFSAMSDSVVVYDAQGRVVRANLAAAEAYGLDPISMDLTEIAEKAFIRYPDGQPAPPDDLPAARALRGEAVTNRRFIMRHARGCDAIIESSASPVMADGRVVGAVAVWRDVTEQECLLETIDGQRQLFQIIVDNVSTGIALLDGRDLRVKWCNSTGLRIAAEQYRRREVIGLRLQDIAPRVVETGVVELFRRVVSTGQPYVNSESEWVDEGGTTYWSSALLPVTSKRDDVPDLLLVTTDITEQVLGRKRLELLSDELRMANASLVQATLRAREAAEQAGRSLAQLEAVVESMTEGLIITDPHGNVLSMNAAAMRMHGYETKEDAQRNLHGFPDTFELCYPDGRPMPVEQYPIGRLLRGETVTRYEVHVRRSGANAVQVWSYDGTSVRGEGGEIILVVLTLRDVTAEKEYQAERERLMVRLEEERQRMEEMLTLIAHDVRQPITVARGHAQFLRRSLERGDLSRALSNVEAIDVSTRRLEAMIRDLVDSVRLETGQLRLERQPLDVTDFAHQVLGRLSAVLDVSHVQVEAVKPVVVYADANRLERVLGNLVSNAVKYCEPGTGITVRVEERDGEGRVSVSDEGPGIDPQDLPHLFDRGYRASRSQIPEGLGLGLYITRLLIEAHGGRVWVESVREVGSAFSFTLPLA